jgi:hypothetical protein
LLPVNPIQQHMNPLPHLEHLPMPSSNNLPVAVAKKILIIL